MFKSYKGNDIDGYVQIRGRWYRLRMNEGEARELLGKYQVECLGWGAKYTPLAEFSFEELKLLKSTLAS